MFNKLQWLLADNTIPAGLKKAQLKQLNRKVAHWTKKVRQPFGEGSDVGGLGDDVTDASPTQNMVKALIKTLKSPEAVPTAIPKAKRRPVDDLTPVATPPTRPAKKKAKQALGGYQEPGPSTPLSAPPRVVGPTRKAQGCCVQRQTTRQKLRQEKRQASGPRRCQKVVGFLTRCLTRKDKSAKNDVNAVAR